MKRELKNEKAGGRREEKGRKRGGKNRGKIGDLETKIKRMEIGRLREREKMKEYSDKRNKKGIREGDIRNRVKEILKKIKIEVKIESVKKIKTEKRDWREMAVVKLENEEKKKKITENKIKRKLKGSTIWKRI